ncbi:MAG TPA: hypothetical protein VGC42_02510 [Kofleriaceae bacterium]
MFPARRGPATPLRVWSSLEDYELASYMESLRDAFPSLEVTLVRTPTGDLAHRLRTGDLGARPPQLIFGTAATVLCEPAIAARLAVTSIAEAPAVGPAGRWVGASGFRNAVACCGPQLIGRGLAMPSTWAGLAAPCYYGLVAMPDPAVSGAGTLALASVIQRFEGDAAWAILAGIKRNAAKLVASSWQCALAALDPATPIALSVEIACRKLADQEATIQVLPLRDASGVEFEGFAMLEGAAEPELGHEVLAWAVGDASRAIARRWRKITLDHAESARGDLAAIGSFALDHQRAARERAEHVARFAALPSAEVVLPGAHA